MWNIFKKKEKKAGKDIYQILLEYIAEARKMGHSDYWIRNKFKSKNYTDKLINLVFEIDKVKEGKIETPANSNEYITLNEALKTLRLGKKYLIENDDIDRTFRLMIKRLNKYSIEI